MCKSKRALNVKNKANPVDVNRFPSLSHRGNALRQGSSWRASWGPVALLLLTLCVCGAAVWTYVTSLDGDITETLVSRSELVSPQPRVYSVPCSEDYENYKRYPGEALRMTPACVTQAAPIMLLCNQGFFFELRSKKWIPHLIYIFLNTFVQTINSSCSPSSSHSQSPASFSPFLLHPLLTHQLTSCHL